MHSGGKERVKVLAHSHTLQVKRPHHLTPCTEEQWDARVYAFAPQLNSDQLTLHVRVR